MGTPRASTANHCNLSPPEIPATKHFLGLAQPTRCTQSPATASHGLLLLDGRRGAHKRIFVKIQIGKASGEHGPTRAEAAKRDGMLLPPPLRRRCPAHLLLLLVALSALAATPVLAQFNECEINPTSESCKYYTMDEAVLQRDIAKLCAGSALGGRTYSGWPSACSLWHECQLGRGSEAGCKPLSLLQTACNESPEQSVCMTYLLLCAPQSVVKQCSDQPPVRELRPAMQYHQAVQTLCKANPARQQCRTCTAQSFDPDKVTVQALQANCPDPLGTMSSMCLEKGGSKATCRIWNDFCDSPTGQGFTALCGPPDSPPPPPPSPVPPSPPSPPPPSPPVEEPPAPAPEAQPEEPLEQPSSPPAEDAGLLSPVPEPDKAPAVAVGCYADPRQASCRTFQQPDADSHADIRQLCSSDTRLVGCSLWQQCDSGEASGSYCQPFSVLGSICQDSPSMAGCERWTALCSTAGSVVEQCVTAGPIRSVLLTSQTLDAVQQACSSAQGMQVEGCQKCTGGSCPDPLALMSQLCLSMPSIPQCRTFANMCAEAGSTFSSLCGQASGSGSGGDSDSDNVSSGGSRLMGAGMMKAYLHASTSATIIFKSWVPSSGGAYVASCLAIIVVAAAVQALKGLNASMEAHWAAQRAHSASSHGSSAEYRSSLCTPRDSIEEKARSRASSGAPMLQQEAAEATEAAAAASSWHQPLVTRQELARNAARSGLAGLTLFLDYMLVLVVVTFNFGLIFCAVLGVCIGALLFGHMPERAAAGASHRGMSAGGLQGPVPDGRLEVHVVANQGGIPAHTAGM